jgi:hypothetical protein
VAREVETRVRTIVGTLRSDDTATPPEHVLAEVQALFKAPGAPARPGMLSALKRVIATLVHDSRTAPALAGLRGGSGAYQLAFESALAAVDLEIRADADSPTRRIMGQVSVGAAQRARAVGLQRHGSAEQTVSAAVDEHGTFTLITESGRFDFVFALDAGELLLADVDVT